MAVLSPPGVAVYPYLALFALLSVGVRVRGQTSGPDIETVVGDSVVFNFSLPHSLALDFTALVIFKNERDINDSMFIFVSNNTIHPRSPNFYGQANYQGDITARQIFFTMRNVTTANAGLYRCGRSSVLSVISSCGQKLVVQGRPTQPSITPSFPGSVAEGSDVTLTCSSNPTTVPEADRLPLSYSWFREGNPVNGGTSGVLVVSPVRRTGVGNYTCRSREGSDRLTSEPSASVFLDVMYGPGRVTVEPPDVYHEVRETTGVVPDIRCQADCNPPCNFQWRDRGGNPVGSTGSRLQLTSINRTQSGPFTCTASNQFGAGNTSIAIFAVYPPDVRVLMSGCAANTTYVTAVDSSVTLTCDVTNAFPGNVSVYEWSVPGSGWQTGDRQQRLTVTKSSAGQYVCRATNSVGTSTPASVTVDVQYPPELSFAPTSVTAMEGGTLEVECRVEARPDVTALRWSRMSGSLPPGANTSLPRLYISHVTRTLSDLYICSTTNRLSPCDVTTGGERTISANVSVHVLWAPSSPTGLQVVSVTSNSVTLTWLTGDTGNAQERWYQLDFRRLVAPGDGWRPGGRVAAPAGVGVRVWGEVGGLSPLTAHVIRVRGVNSEQQGGDVTNSSTEVVAQTAALPDSCDLTAPVAAGVVVTFIVSVISTLAVVYVVHRHRHRGTKDPAKSIYENADFDTEMTSEGRGGRVTSSRSGSPTAPTEREEGGYSVLDLQSRERPRDVTAYEVIARRGPHGSQESRDSGSQGNQGYANVAREGEYSSTADL